MDDRRADGFKKLENFPKQTADAAVELSRLDGTVEGMSHYSFIELHANELGQRLSRQI